MDQPGAPPKSSNTMMYAIVIILVIAIAYYMYTKQGGAAGATAASAAPAPPAPPIQHKFNGHVLQWGGPNNQTPYGGQFGRLDQAQTACQADSRCSGVGTFATPQTHPQRERAPVGRPPEHLQPLHWVHGARHPRRAGPGLGEVTATTVRQPLFLLPGLGCPGHSEGRKMKVI